MTRRRVFRVNVDVAEQSVYSRSERDAHRSINVLHGSPCGFFFDLQVFWAVLSVSSAVQEHLLSIFPHLHVCIYTPWVVSPLHSWNRALRGLDLARSTVRYRAPISLQLPGASPSPDAFKVLTVPSQHSSIFTFYPQRIRESIGIKNSARGILMENFSGLFLQHFTENFQRKNLERGDRNSFPSLSTY